MRKKDGKSYKILARLMKEDIEEFKKIQLEKYRWWGPKAVFSLQHIFEILSAESKLEILLFMVDFKTYWKLMIFSKSSPKIPLK